MVIWVEFIKRSFKTEFAMQSSLASQIVISSDVTLESTRKCCDAEKTICA